MAQEVAPLGIKLTIVEPGPFIIQITNIENPPLRLPLGKIPLNTIQMKIDSVQKDLNDWRSVAESAVFV